MKMNRFLLSLLFAFTLMISSVSAYDYYKVHEVSFTDEAISNFYVNGAVCANADCSSITSNEITLLDTTSFNTCLTNYQSNNNVEELSTCLVNAELEGNIVDLGSTSAIVTKESTAPNNFNAITYFMPQGDTYVPKISEGTQYPVECSAEGINICFDTNVYQLEFGKISEAIAEVGQVNIKNVDNPLLPIQVEIPVQIEETVCSAYRFANENYWYPTQIPSGYSDFDATTQIDLLIQDSNGTTLLEDQVIIPIEAETCAGLSAFSWTPSASLEDEEVTFTVTTEVIDMQVITSLIDYAIVTETIYPEQLDGTCWTRAYDFTLANAPTFDLTTSLAQIQQGEFLYAGFKGGAWRDESVSPMQFEAIMVFDDGTTETIVSSLQDTSGLDVTEYFEDVSATILNLNPGNYEVTLVTRPQGPNCIVSEEVRQTQQLTILEVPKYTLDVFVTGNDSQSLEGVTINVELDSTRDEFQVTPVYTETQATDVQGYSEFTGLIAGTYSYTATKDGYSTVTNEVIIGSNTQIYINLPQSNVAPIVDLPETLSMYYLDELDIKLQDYVVDFNDAFNSLDIQVEVVSGQATATIVNIDGILEIRTTTPNQVEVRVTATDAGGLSAQDTITIDFIDNAEPVIARYEADPTNGQEPFSTSFLVEVEDVEGSTLTCTIDFDDGTSETFDCAQTDGLISVDHTFTEVGQYNTVLSVQDEVHTVTLEEKVFVFERTFESPQILTYNFDSTNGLELPTNITLDWTTTHPDDLPLTCTLRVNGVNNAVDCNSNIELSDYTTPGVNVFSLIASDGERQDLRRIERTFVFPEDEAPTASISADVLLGVSPVDVVFTITVSDDNDALSNLNCRVDFGDGTFVEDTCDELTQASHTYTTNAVPISYRALLTVQDSVDNEVRAISELIVVEPRVNNVPVIEVFSASEVSGIDTLTTDFTIELSDADNDTVSYALNFGDGSSSATGNQESAFISHTYDRAGNYDAILVVSDGFSTVNSIIQIEVLGNEGPVINDFSFSSSNNLELPTDITFIYDASHAQGLGVTCSLIINTVSTPVTCTGNLTIEDYSTQGVASFIFEVEDENGVVTQRELNPNFVRVNNVPVIEVFGASEVSGIDTLTTDFTIELSDADNDTVSYVLNFGDGSPSATGNQESAFISHTYDRAGNYDAILVVSDGFSTVNSIIQIEVLGNEGPVINDFSFSSSNNLELPTDITFIYDASHAQGLGVTCSLIINTVSTPVTCTGNLTIEDYSTQGVASFIFEVEDENGVVTQRELNPNFVRVNNVPVIEVFEANQTTGIGSLETEFTYIISDVDADDSLTYTLNFGDTQSVTGTDLSGIIKYNYTLIGQFDALLSVTDGVDTVTSVINLEVLDPNAQNNRPSIDLFSLETGDGTFVLPNTITLSSAVSHPRGFDVTCDLVTPLGTQFNIGCNGVITLNDFNISGISEFTLIATDANMISSNMTLTQEFFTPEVAPDLTLDMVSIDIDEVITPGAFSFALRTKNETLAKRELFVQPTISCGGVEFGYSNGRVFLPTIALSSQDLDESFKFPLRTDTDEYLGAIPTGETCLFEARVIDAYGTDITVVKNVEFNYPVQEIAKPSIDGHGTEVMNFISNTINEPFTTGYNKIDFTLVNYESETKEISISLSSTQLGIGYNEEVKLGPDTVKDVTVPLVFNKNQKGTYPIRVAINDGEQKQVKYSYITIK